jgi:hypothetical protein
MDIETSITRRIISYKKANENVPVSGKVKTHNHKFNCKDYGVAATGKTNLGICRSEIGLRSICLGVAMAMYLTGVPVFIIMLIRI